MVPRLVAYVRTSTDDQQSPEDSRRWQLARAEALIAGRAEISVVVHDRDISRAVPWTRRPEGSALLAQLANPGRGWDGVVIGEPQRAFGNAAQVQLLLCQFAEDGVSLWVPQVGGPVDPESEAHDILLSLFGGLSRAERNRLRLRVRTAMRAMAPTGRFLGGRPPYGYQLAASGVPHPNPEKARHGIQLSKLQLDLKTAPVIEQIFQWRAEGLGWKAIAARLTEAGIPSPSAADPDRNSHRPGRAWASSAVRAIVLNPRYKGTGVYGRYRKVERLYDPADPAAGHITRMTPAHRDDWVEAEGTVPAIVTHELWAAAQPTPTRPAGNGPRPDRPGPNRYSLRGLVACGQCGRLM